MAVTEDKEPGGFWVPNELIDVALEHVGVRGAGLYCTLGRQALPQRYPSVQELAKKTRLSRNLVRVLIAKLFDYKLLNDFDLRMIEDATDAYGIPDDNPEDNLED